MRRACAARARAPAVRRLWTRRRGIVVVVVAAVALATPASVSSGSVRRTASGRPVDARLFAPGACVEFPPSSGDRHLIVFLDAGHGGLDPGAVGETESGATVEEANETLPVELDTARLLEAKGFTVVVSRTGAGTVSRPQPGDVSGNLFTVQGVHDDVAARDECADLAHANVLLGIYFDAGASSLDAGSVTGYDTDRPFAAQNLRLATLVQGDVLGAMNAQGWGIPDLGVVDDSELGGPPLDAADAAYDHLLLLGPADPGYFSTPSEMPGALIEPLFVTDSYEGSLAVSPTGQEVVAGGLAQAVEQYFVPRARGGPDSQAAGDARHHPANAKPAA